MLIIPLATHNIAIANGTTETTKKTNNLNRIFIIEDNENSFVDDFALLATIPANVFLDSNGTIIKGPIIKSDIDEGTEFFLSEWKEYCDNFGGVSQAVVIGDISKEKRILLEKLLDQRIIPRIEFNDVFSLANKIAVFDWTNSDTAVIAVIDNPDEYQTQILTNESMYQFVNSESNTTTYSNNINSGSSLTYNFLTTNDTGWTTISIDWDKNNTLTHEVIDPTGFIIDNTTAYTTEYTRSLGDQKILSVLPNVKPGLWNITIRNESATGEPENFTLTIKQYPGLRRDINIPPNTLWLNISISWEMPYIDLDLIAISPSGRVVDWSTITQQKLTNRSVSIPFPENGTWQFLVSWWEGSGSLAFNLKTNIETYNSTLFYSLLSSQNGAVIASMNNAPLLYTTPVGLTQEINSTLSRINVKKIIVLDLNNRSSSLLISQLNNTYIIEKHITNIPSTIDYFQLMGFNNQTIITYPLEDYASISTILAAVQNKPVLMLGKENITSLAGNTWLPLKMKIGGVLPQINEHVRYFEKNYLDERVPYYYSMVEVSDAFDKFIKTNNLPENLTITLIAPEKILPASFDRSLIGKYIIGRFSNEPSTLDSIIMRSVFRDSIIPSSSEVKSLLTYYAYSYGSEFIDNNNNKHSVFNRDNVTTILGENKADMENHTGSNKIIETLHKGVDLWIISTHTVLDSTGERDKSRILVRDIDAQFWFEPGGTSEDPDVNGDGIVDPLNWVEEEYRMVYLDAEWFKSNLDRINNTMIITTCLITPMFSNIFLDKGATSIIGSYRTVSFQAIMWCSNIIINKLLQNYTIGESLKEALLNCSTIYSLNNRSDYEYGIGDFTLQLVLYGDPTLTLKSPNTTLTNCLTIDEFGENGHTPSKGVGLIAILGKSNDLPTIIDKINTKYGSTFSYNFLNVSELTSQQLLNQLMSYKLILVQSDAQQEAEDIFKNETEKIYRFIENGGTLIIYNCSAPILWTPLKIESLKNENGIQINFTDNPHPLKNYPINLSENYAYNKVFYEFSSEFNIIANGTNGTTWVAGAYGSGKISVLTIAADKLNYTEIIYNCLIWSNLKGLKAKILLEPNTPVVYLGDRLTIKVNITDIFDWNVKNTSIKFILQGEEIQPINSTENQYIFDVTNNITLGEIKIEVLVWKIDADPDYQTLSFKVLNRPWLLIGLGIFITISISGYIAFKIKTHIENKKEKNTTKSK